MRWCKHELTTSIIGGTVGRNFAKKESVNVLVGLTIEGFKKKTKTNLPLNN